MALLFSQVTVTAGNDTVSFLVGGIPREYDDLEDWDEFDDFLKYIDEETEVLVHADAYTSREKLILAITKQYPQEKKLYPRAGNASGGQSMTEPAEATTAQEINHAAQQAKAPKPVRTG